jgi:RNA dependent RNA polymerase
MATLIPNEEGSVDAFQDAWSDEDGLDEEESDTDSVGLEDNLWMFQRCAAINDGKQLAFRRPSSVPGVASSSMDVTSDVNMEESSARKNVVSPLPSFESDDNGKSNNDEVRGEIEKADAPVVGTDEGRFLLRLPPPPASVDAGEEQDGPTVVEIIGGVHKGESAYLVRQTAQKVAVRLLDDDPSSKPRYLAPSSVRVVASASQDSEPVRPPAPLPPKLPRTVASNQTRRAEPTAKEVGVDIIGGVYKGRQDAVLVRRTDKRACVRFLDDGPDSKPRYLLPGNVRVRGMLESDAPADWEEPSYGVWEPRSAAGSQPTATPNSARGQRYDSHSRARDLVCHFNTFLGFPIQHVLLQSPGEKSPLAGTFAGYVFGSRLVEFRIKADGTVDELPRVFDAENGCTYELLVTKLQKTSTSLGGNASVCRTDVKAIYVLTKGPGVEPLDLETELSKIAAFYALTPTKAASRLELFCSSARKSTRQGQDFLMFDDLTSSDFELISEVANEGCGFCPPHFIQRWLGNHAVGKRTFALQVRVFGSKIGIGKGVLMVKPGIERIQLPPSMVKVGPSHLDGQDTAVILVNTNGVFPFPAHRHAACVLLGEKPPPKSFVPKRLSPMIFSLFRSIGVPDDLLDLYAEEVQEERGKNLKHASLVGLADPTSTIPSGHIYVTGIHGCCEFGPDLFVTRYPCTERTDGTVWPLVREQPNGMSDSDWSFLQSLHFGGILFGNPLPGQPPMPNMIADGDLDGDLYFVCWHARILSQVCVLKGLPACEAVGVVDYEPPSTPLVSYDWLQNAQDVMRSIRTVVEKHAIIGILYKHMERAAKASDPADPADAHFFSVAYKEAIDVGKHGGSVTLPRYLWSTIDERFHRYLRDSGCG